MKIARLLFLAAAALSITAILPNESAARGKANTAPGSYKDWNDVDEVTIVQPFQLGSYSRVVVAPFQTSGAEMPDAKDNSFAPAKEALESSTGTFVAGVKRKLGNMPVEQAAKGGAGSLVVRARVLMMSPGSQAARYFGGFGAGAAATAISGEILDGKTNAVLVRFKQERRSGVGAFGGGYKELLNRNIEQIGGDIAGLLRAF